jgi:HEPN domain-containing protein
VVGHALVELLDGVAPDHPAVAELRELAQQLDQYYIPTRYPNGLPGGVPADVFTRRQAADAVTSARRFLETVRAEVDRAEG